MLIAERNAILAGAALPYDAEVDYLESTGTQWIDTGVPYNHTIVFEADIAKTANIASGYLFGILWASGGASTLRRWGVNWSNDYKRFYPQYYTTTDVFYSVDLVNGVKHTIWADANKFAFDGMVINVTSSTFDPTVDVSVYLLARHTYAPQLDPNPVTGIIAWRIFSCKISNGNTLVRDFIPVRFTNELGNSEGAMYDRVSGQLFRNSGTGAFVIGPDASAANVGGV